jgi:hypothetical protein
MTTAVGLLPVSMLLMALRLENSTSVTISSKLAMSFYVLSAIRDNHRLNRRKLPEKSPKGSARGDVQYMQYETFERLLNTLFVLVQCAWVCSACILDRLSTHPAKRFSDTSAGFFTTS